MCWTLAVSGFLPMRARFSKKGSSFRSPSSSLRGSSNDELIKILSHNVRTPEPVLGDIYAQAAGNDVGAERLVEFMREFGLDSLEPLADEIIDRSEQAMRRAIAELPDGIYRNEVWSDGYEQPVKLAVAIEKTGDRMHVDWAGSSPESDAASTSCSTTPMPTRPMP